MIAFQMAGATSPASRLDMCTLPGGGDPPKMLTRVDPGAAWVFHFASLVGFPLSIAGICLFQLLVVVLASYAALALRARDENLGSVLHTRSQLWHTLYIGLGCYGDWDGIQWLDEYAYGVAAAAGVSAKDSIPYERLLRNLFLQEVSHHPVRYGLLLMRRAGDYFDAPRSSMPLLGRLGRRSALGWLSILVVAAFFFSTRSPVSELLILYVSGVAIWSLLLPPIPIYATETLGLWAPITAVFLVSAFERAFGKRWTR